MTKGHERNAGNAGRSLKNVIFDYDGTLHETMRIYGPAFRKNYEFLAAQGLMPARQFEDAEISEWLGYPAGDMWRRFAPQLSEAEQGACSARIQEEMARLIENGTARLYPAVPTLLDTLKRAGFGIYLLSNCKSSYLDAHRRVMKLDRWFDGYYWGEAEGWAPKPEIMKKLLREHPGAAVMVGDRFLDFEAARAFDLPFIACAYGYGSPEEWREAAAVAASPEELKTLIPQLLPAAPWPFGVHSAGRPY